MAADVYRSKGERAKVIFKSKNVLCSNCGFLGWYVIRPISLGVPVTIESELECGPRIREDFQKGVDVGKPENEVKGETVSGRIKEKPMLFCHRRQWTLTWSKEGNDNYSSQPGEIRQSRQCRYYNNYHPGYTPAEHKELIREARMKRTMVFATLGGALVGASIGALAAFIAELLFNF